MTKKLIERLREGHKFGDSDAVLEAADLIEQQQKRIDYLESRVDSWTRDAQTLMSKLAASQAQIKVLRDVIQDEWDYQERNYSEPSLALMLALQEPTDDSALREMLAAERERVAKVVRDASFKIQSGSPHRKIFDAVVAEIRAMEDQ